MVEANLKKKIEKIRRGELKPRKYPGKIIKNPNLSSKPIGTTIKEVKKLTDEFPTAKKHIEDEIQRIVNYYNKKPFKERSREFFIQKIKRPITLYNENVEEKTKKEESKKELTEEEVKQILKRNYPKIIKILRRYCDLREEYYNIISLWILGTYIHKQFPTYPYLYFNAMKGSGKTRILNLISHLSRNGKLSSNMSEAVLFRTASDRTFCLDEFERVSSKEKVALKELLNVAYKKGGSIERIKKVKSKIAETYQVEEFDVYCPVAMANIWGMEEVLGDRCIQLILEKSINKNITRKLEIFELDEDISRVKQDFSVVIHYTNRDKHILQNLLILWNKLHEEKTLHYITTHTTYTQQTTQTTPLLKKIEKTSLDSRHLELFFPLFIVADFCGVLDKTIKTSEILVKEKKADDVMESRDISLLAFVAQYDKETSDFLSVKELNKEFKEWLAEEAEESKWLNVKWFGRALRRLALIKEKRRLGRGVEVIVNFKKAKEKIKVFREVEPELPQETKVLEPQETLDVEEEKV